MVPQARGTNAKERLGTLCNLKGAQLQFQMWNFKISHDKESLPRWLSGKESACQCRRHRFDPWSGTIPHAMEHLSPCTPTIESASRVSEPLLSLPAAATEALLCSKRSHCNEKPIHCN